MRFRQVPPATRKAIELIRVPAAALHRGWWGVLLALQLTSLPASANLRTEAFSALNQCSSSRQQQSCLDAETSLRALIGEQEGFEQREQQPRCLGALTHVEAVLATFRWRLETNENLKRVIRSAESQCPANSAADGK